MKWASKDNERIAGICGRIQTLAFRGRGHGEHLRGSLNLPQPLVFDKVIGSAFAVVEVWQHDRAAIGKTKLIADERRNSARGGGRGVIEIVPGIEGGVAQEFEKCPMHIICARFRNDIGIAGSAFTYRGGHHAGEGIDALDSIDVEIGDGAPPCSGSVVSPPSSAKTA